MNYEQLENLVSTYGSPLYIYDYATLVERSNQMKSFKDRIENALKTVKINMHYSSKANGNPAILKIVKETGLKVDSMSPLELNIAQKCGFTKDQILYVCNNIDSEEMRLVHENDILICLDSISQVEMWGRIYPGTNIMVRINPGTKGVGHSDKVITSGKVTKFGIGENNITKLINATKKYNLNIIGVHQHLGSLFLDDTVDDYIAGVKSGIELIRKYFENIKIVDLGGGFGVPYKPHEKALNLDTVADRLTEVLKEFIASYPSVEEFNFEPGRFIPCEAGMLLGKVTAIKNENNVWWIGTDIGMNDLVRPSMYDAYHEIEIISANPSSEIIHANICGNICESADVLGKDRNIPKPNIGDIVLVKNAGAYGYSMASNYTGRLRPAEVMIYPDHEKLIRKRETIEYIESNIIWD